MARFQTWTKGIMTSICRSCLHVLVMTSGLLSAPPWLNPASFGPPPDFRAPWNRPVEKRKTVEARRDLRLLVDDISFHFKFDSWLFCARWAPPIRRVITPATRPIYFRPFKGGVIERGPPCAYPQTQTELANHRTWLLCNVIDTKRQVTTKQVTCFG